MALFSYGPFLRVQAKQGRKLARLTHKPRGQTLAGGSDLHTVQTTRVDTCFLESGAVSRRRLLQRDDVTIRTLGATVPNAVDRSACLAPTVRNRRLVPYVRRVSAPV